MIDSFKIDFLDHVAIRVKDLEVSAGWYKKVLGLKAYQFKEWGPFPIFLLAGKTGVALFPARTNDPVLNPQSRNVKIDHFAFNVTNENFEKAIRKMEHLEEPFDLQDHHFFQSIYLKDPDGHTVELTTIMVPEASFYDFPHQV